MIRNRLNGCEHEVPCDCGEYLERLENSQLIRYKLETAKTLCTNKIADRPYYMRLLKKIKKEIRKRR